MKMARIRATCFIAALLCGGIACAQSATSFLAVDVHVSAPNESRELIGMFPESDRYELRGVTMVELISNAWDMNADRISGGPAWLASDHYDFIAKAPPGVKEPDLKPLLQAVLAERFGLAVHNDTRRLRLRSDRGEGRREDEEVGWLGRQWVQFAGFRRAPQPHLRNCLCDLQLSSPDDGGTGEYDAGFRPGLFRRRSAGRSYESCGRVGLHYSVLTT
jgi:hypothetical protein